MDDAGWNPILSSQLKARGYQMWIKAALTKTGLVVAGDGSLSKKFSDLKTGTFGTSADTRLAVINDTDVLALYIKFTRTGGAGGLSLSNLAQAANTVAVDTGNVSVWWADSSGNFYADGTAGDEWTYTVIAVLTKGEP